MRTTHYFRLDQCAARLFTGTIYVHNYTYRYLQVTKVATYGYFLFALISRQDLRLESPYMKNNEHYISLYFPFITTLEFIFYFGWLTVGDNLL
jgi:hypothetical protein